MLGSSEFVQEVLSHQAAWEHREVLQRARQGTGLAELGAAVARHLGLATPTANRAVAGELDPLAQRLLETLAPG